MTGIKTAKQRNYNDNKEGRQRRRDGIDGP